MNTKQSPSIEKEPKENYTLNKYLILHNDDIHSFEFVIEALVSICKHDKNQAEQCAYITHYKGKCDVKVGEYEYLSMLKYQLSKEGLKVTIE